MNSICVSHQLAGKGFKFFYFIFFKTSHSLAAEMWLSQVLLVELGKAAFLVLSIMAIY